MLRFLSCGGLLFLAAALLLSPPGVGALAAGDKKEKKKEDEPEVRKGKVTGVLVAKELNKAVFIEVKGDGEAKARKYVPHWVGGAPSAGGGYDKDMVKIFTKLKIGSRVEVSWEYLERFRAVAVKVLEERKEK